MEIRVSTASRGQFLGLSDVICNRWHTTTVKCVSTTGSIYVIKINDFIQKMKKDPDLLKKLTNISTNSDLELKYKIKHSAKYLQDYKPKNLFSPKTRTFDPLGSLDFSIDLKNETIDSS